MQRGLDQDGMTLAVGHSCATSIVYFYLSLSLSVVPGTLELSKQVVNDLVFLQQELQLQR